MTEQATKQWQINHSLTGDGIVGTATWGRADNNISQDPDGTYRYNGTQRSPRFILTSGNVWWDPPGDSSITYYKTGHPDVTFPVGGGCP